MLPGNVRTEGLGEPGEGHLRRMTAPTLLGRLGETVDIAHAVGFLASDEAAFITGRTLTVDGGRTGPESLDALAPAGGDPSLSTTAPA